MKRLMAILLAAVLLIPAAALAEVYLIEDEAGLPEGWDDKEILRWVVVDTNRSDAMLLMCGGEAMMVDGGFNSHYRRVFQTLDSYGVKQLKYLLSTHCDGDHSEGLTSIINSDLYDPQVLLSPNSQHYDDPDDHQEKLVRAANLHGVPYQVIGDGDVFTLGGAKITIVRCSENWGQNARSAACMVEFNGGRLLLLADVSNRVLKHFLETRAAADLDCDVMKAPHHGIDGVNDAFMAAASPDAIICTNSLNRDHDKKLENAGAIYSGDGSVTVETDGTDWYIWQDPNWID